eukprot:1395324-Lingulodinium_polyedra.AAC.1
MPRHLQVSEHGAKQFGRGGDSPLNARFFFTTRGLSRGRAPRGCQPTPIPYVGRFDMFQPRSTTVAYS